MVAVIQIMEEVVLITHQTVEVTVIADLQCKEVHLLEATGLTIAGHLLQIQGVIPVIAGLAIQDLILQVDLRQGLDQAAATITVAGQEVAQAILQEAVAVLLHLRDQVDQEVLLPVEEVTTNPSVVI